MTKTQASSTAEPRMVRGRTRFDSAAWDVQHSITGGAPRPNATSDEMSPKSLVIDYRTGRGTPLDASVRHLGLWSNGNSRAHFAHGCRFESCQLHSTAWMPAFSPTIPYTQRDTGIQAILSGPTGNRGNFGHEELLRHFVTVWWLDGNDNADRARTNDGRGNLGESAPAVIHQTYPTMYALTGASVKTNEAQRRTRVL